MKIGHINNNLGFTRIISPKAKVAEEIFGAKQDVYDTISSAKKLDIWTIKECKGGAANMHEQYRVIVQDTQGGEDSITKEFVASDDEESKDKLFQKLEQCIIWANAPMNIIANEALMRSKAAEQEPELADGMSDKLIKAGLSREAGAWRTKVEIL